MVDLHLEEQSKDLKWCPADSQIDRNEARIIEILKRIFFSLMLWFSQEEPPEPPEPAPKKEERQFSGKKGPKNQSKLYRINWDTGGMEPYDPFQ